METIIYNQEGKEAGKVKLPERIFGAKWNADLVHQVVTSMQTSARKPYAHTKDRGEVAGGGKKPWRQKGTGRARHGSIRSPIWVGGGVAHGPRNEKNFDRKVNRKMKTAALASILSKKFKEGEVLLVESLDLKEPKAKEARGVLANLSAIKGFHGIFGKNKNAAYLAVSKKNVNLRRGFRNFGNLFLDEVRNLNPIHALQYRYLILANPKESIALLESKFKNN